MDGSNTKHGTRNPKHHPQSGLTFRFMRSGEEQDVCDLVRRVFNHAVAPLYNRKGLLNFYKYADPEEMSHRVQGDHFILLALAGDDIAGMIELRRYSHISLLFVEQEHQGRGIGRDLIKLAAQFCLTRNPRLKEVTVNSSPNAVKAYEGMGFKPSGVEQTISGVRSIPMKKVLGEKRG